MPFLGIEKSVKPILSAQFVNMILVITIHQTNYPSREFGCLGAKKG